MFAALPAQPLRWDDIDRHFLQPSIISRQFL
jgi:hypothetical protein